MEQGFENWSAALIHPMALASRLEREGQFNVAKLAQVAAGADGLCHRPAVRHTGVAQIQALVRGGEAI